MNKILLIHRSLGMGGAEKSIAFLANTFVNCYEVELLLLESKDITIRVNKQVKIVQKNSYLGSPIIGKGMISGLCQLNHMRDDIIEAINIFNPSLIVCFDLRILLCISTVKHNGCKILFSERADPNDNPLYWKFYLKHIYKKIDMVVFQTDGARNFYKNSEKINYRVIPNPALSRIQEKRPQIQKHNKIIFSAGRFQYRKGFDLLIKAFASISDDFPEYKLVIYGDGEEKPKLEKLISNYKLKNRILLKPAINNVIYSNKEAALFVLPSRSEGIPNILIEAMMEEIPCVAADCSPGGARLLSDDGKYCLLSKNNDDISLASQINYALSNNDKMRNMARDAAKSMDRFSIIKIGQEWMDVIDHLLPQK